MEAVFMYHAFVVVWPPREENDVLKCTIAAWGKHALLSSRFSYSVIQIVFCRWFYVQNISDNYLTRHKLTSLERNYFQF